MRKALALAAFLAMAPYAQAQESASNHSFNAEYRARYQFDNNIAGSKDRGASSQDHIRHRFKLGGTFKATDDLSATVTLLHNADWGSSGFGYGGTGDGPHRAQLNGTGDHQNMMLVQEAYGTWMVNNELTLRFGRGSFTMGDGTVIHDNDWEDFPVTFEGLLATYEMEFGRLSAFGVRFAEYKDAASGALIGTGGAVTAQDPEANSYGLSYSHKSLPEFLKRADLHVNKIQKAVTGATVPPARIDLGQDLLRYGISLAGDVSLLDWRAVYNAHQGDYIVAGGTKIAADGNMLEAEIGANFEEFMKSRVYVLYHQDSGDDGTSATSNDTYDAYFYNRHYNAGLMDVVGWGNLTDLAVGWTLEPMDQMTVGLHYHKFEKTEKDGAATPGLWGSQMMANTAAHKDLGQEIDLVATQAYDNGLMILGRLGYFMPGKAVKDANPGVSTDDYMTVFVEAKMNF